MIQMVVKSHVMVDVVCKSSFEKDITPRCAMQRKQVAAMVGVTVRWGRMMSDEWRMADDG